MRVEVIGSKEVDMHADLGPRRDIARAVLLRQRSYPADGGKIGRKSKVSHVLGHLAEPGEDDTVADVGIHGREGVGHGRSERVADVNQFAELAAHLGDFALASHLRDCFESGNFEINLDFVDSFAVGGFTYAEAVPR